MDLWTRVRLPPSPSKVIDSNLCVSTEVRVFYSPCYPGLLAKLKKYLSFAGIRAMLTPKLLSPTRSTRSTPMKASHPDPNEPDEDGNDAPDDMDGMFRFQKDMR